MPSANVENWLKWDRNETTLAEVRALVAAGNDSALSAIMDTPMAFGTAGLRAKMGAGFACMNDLTVVQAAQGLAAHILATVSAEDIQEKGIVGGHDARHGSKRFARLSANVFLAAGIKTYLFSDICPTPFVAYGVRHFGCVSGVMVTASHNPKEDNGYKVYWSNGAQIVSPIDSHIAAAIQANLAPKESSWVDQPGAIDALAEVRSEFFKTLKPIFTNTEKNGASPLKFTYSAMHGVGAKPVQDAMACAGFTEEQLVMVKEQEQPDPEFPTVAFPNPEEGKSSLNLAFKTAEAAGSTIIVANDPDADRLAVAQHMPDGTWKVFTGNQIGALLGWWAVECHKKQHPEIPVTKCAMFASAVSSVFLGSMAKVEGFLYEECLTGFKHMGSKSNEMSKPENGGYKVLFAFEEAIGFMFGDRVWDKDGVTALPAFAEMCVVLHEQESKTPWDKIQDLFAKYGSHFSDNSYMIGRDPVKNKAMFDNMRVLENGGFPTSIAGVKVASIRDLGTGLDSACADRKALLPSNAAAPMITFRMENGIVLTIRGSGTEPKIKWYSETVGSTSTTAEADLREFVSKAVVELMQPDKFGLVRRST